MKREVRPMNAIRREIDNELSFLNDRPSLHYDIMSQIKGESVVKKKMSVGLVLVVMLVFLTLAGLAVSVLRGYVFLDQEAHGQLYTCAVKDDNLYVLGKNGLWVYYPGSEHAQQVVTRENLPPYRNPLQLELLAANDLMLLDTDAQKVWVLDGDRFSLVKSYANTELARIDGQGTDFIWQDGMLFIQSDHEGAVYRIDLTSCKAEKLPIANVTRLANYLPGKLLGLTYTEQLGTKVIVIDSITGEYQELCADPGLGIKWVVFAEKKNDIYSIVSGSLSRWNDDGWETVCGVAMPHVPFFIGVFGDTYAVANYEGLQLIPLDGPENAVETIVIHGLFDSAQYDHGFQQAYPGMTIARRDEADFDIDAAMQAMQSGGNADLFHVRLSTESVDELWSMVELLNSEKLHLDVGEMMPALQSLLIQNGKLYALPSTMLVEAWQTEKRQENVPSATLLELLKSKQILFGEESFEGTNLQTTLWGKEDYAALLLKQALRERKTGTLRFTDSAFADTLQTLKELSEPAQSSDAEVWLHTTASLVGYLHGSEGVIPYTMPPRLEEGTPPQVPAYVTVYVLNPNSQHKAEAILYLEYLAEHRFSWDDALMKPQTAKPVLTEWAQERLLKFEKEYGSDPEYLNMQRKQIEDDPENWEVLAENLAFYRDHIAPYIVIDDIFHLNLDEMAMLQLIQHYLDGSLGIEECVNQLEQMI